MDDEDYECPMCGKWIKNIEKYQDDEMVTTCPMCNAVFFCDGISDIILKDGDE